MFTKTILFFSLLLLFILLAACQSQEVAAVPNPTVEGRMSAGALGISPHTYLGRFENLDLKEPSGIIFHPGRGTLFVIGDKGHLAELQTDGLKMRQERLGEKDTEGITYNPETGNLYAAVEGAESILEVDPVQFAVIQEIRIERTFEGEVILDPSAESGIEGITFVPDESREGGGLFYLTSQSANLEEPSLILEVEVSGPAGQLMGKITGHFTVPVSDLSGIYYDQPHDRLLVISDDNNVLLHLSRSGEILDSYALPGEHQEGITLDEEGFLYIAEDADNLIMKFQWNEAR